MYVHNISKIIKMVRQPATQVGIIQSNKGQGTGNARGCNVFARVHRNPSSFSQPDLPSFICTAQLYCVDTSCETRYVL